LYGTVGGGVVEEDIRKIAAEAIKSGNSGHFHFNLANDISHKDEAICGGRISVLVDADTEKNRQAFTQAAKSLKGNLPGVLVTVLNGDDERKLEIGRFWIDERYKPSLPQDINDMIISSAGELIAEGSNGTFREIMPGQLKGKSSMKIFLEPVFPSPKLIIAGAGHIGKALSHLGNILGFEVTVIDDRSDLACTDNLPDAHRIIVGDIGKEIHKIPKDNDTYVVIVTRGHKDDAEALKTCIGKSLAYTGMIGSRKKVNAIHDSFLSNGWATQEQWDTVYAPVGLEIGSQTVEEIAVSIAAQIILVKNNIKRQKK
jgi:xanthine dehydrogenase accessory factor